MGCLCPVNIVVRAVRIMFDLRANNKMSDHCWTEKGGFKSISSNEKCYTKRRSKGDRVCVEHANW